MSTEFRKIYAVVDHGDHYTPRYEAYYDTEKLAHEHMRKFHPRLKQSPTDKSYGLFYIEEIDVYDGVPNENPY